MPSLFANQPSSAANCVAIIGMAGRFPGADDVAAFWQNLIQGRSGIIDVTGESSHASRLPQQEHYVGKTAMIPHADHFDAEFFGIFPRQAVEMDPQHRLFLETCWHALEDAGYVPDATPGRVGLFAGCHMNTYILTRLATDARLRGEFSDAFPGGGLSAEIANDKDYLATRVAYHLNLRGPCMAVQTACSTSAVAVAQACESLLAGSCDMALAGGATVTFPQNQGYLHTEHSILSPDGTCRTFDADARGTVFGDGVAAIVLKRTDLALADGDDIYAVIRGWGVNNDGGDKPGYTAPSVSGQSDAILQAHRRAGVTADTITYVEAHGTGTLVGDPIEIQALSEAFASSTDAKQYCYIGSAKTNIGHLDVAAGVTGIIKTALSLRHRQLPPMLHFRRANPRIDFANSPFVPTTRLTDWPSETEPRRAGVSSFGVGGTNAHLVLEEAPAVPQTPSARPFHLLAVSARTPAAVEPMRNDLAEYLERHRELNLADVCHTLQTGRKSFASREYRVVESTADAVRQLREESTGGGPAKQARPGTTAVAFVFPGQGSQHQQMARQLYDTEPVVRRHIDACAEHLQSILQVDLRRLVFSDSPADAARLNETQVAQPALFMVSYALGRWWQSLGLRPTAMLGHSVGEFAAAALAGVMDRDDAATLVAHRGRLMQALPAGAMLAVHLDEAALRARLPEALEIAAINGPSFCVVAGAPPDVASFAEALGDEKAAEPIACRLLRTSHAFHSATMEPAIEPFAQLVRQVELRSPTTTMVSSVTGRPLDAATATDPAYWARQIREPVRFSAAFLELLGTTGDPLAVLEVGPSQALSTLARQHPLDPKRHTVVASLPHAQHKEPAARHAVSAVGRLWQAGVAIDWSGLYGDEPRRRVHLPKYRFQRKRYHFETSPTPDAEAPAEPRPAPSASAMRRVIDEQMLLMQQQLELLRRGNPQHMPTPSSTPPRTSP
ncbi:type I polyketide synthase [Roseimaritima sediminicola]|uniref:type I polyketide synthase n=1 Tax=Roseimaritima sediminicola TaxID=2662066 RepID=UPI00129828D5|nr:type I polyketide synthase [Roseimaritima sediminicola]